MTQAWLELLSHRFNNALQIGSAAPIEAESAQSAVDFLFPVLVAPPQSVARSRTRTRIVSDLQGLFEQTAGLAAGRSLLRQPRAAIGRQRGRFDFAVVDSSVEQLSQAFAFDVRNADDLEQELQSWNFVVGRLRNDGARLTAEERTLVVSADVPVAVAYQEPTASASARHQDVFEAALEAWAALDVEAVPSTELDVIARDARELVAV